MRLPSAQASFIVFGTAFITLPEIIMLFFPSKWVVITALSSSLAFNSALVILIWFGHHYFKPVVAMIGDFYLPKKLSGVVNKWIKQ